MQVIDGQQRITTLVLIAAVSQHVLRDLAGQMDDGHSVKELALQASTGGRPIASPIAFVGGGSDEIFTALRW